MLSKSNSYQSDRCLHECFLPRVIQGSDKSRVLSLVNFVPSLACLFCLALPVAFTQPGALKMQSAIFILQEIFDVRVRLVPCTVYTLREQEASFCITLLASSPQLHIASSLMSVRCDLTTLPIWSQLVGLSFI